MNLDFNTLRQVNVKRCETVFHKLDDWSLSDWATAMAGECGEACDVVKKIRRLDGVDKAIDTSARRNKLKRDLGKELADAICYIDLLAARAGINLSDVVVDKFDEVSDRRGSDIKLGEHLIF